MPRAPRFAQISTLTCFAVFGCAGAHWPNEPGVAVPLSTADNARASDAFIEALTARRAGQAVARPIVIPSLQRALSPVGQKLQAGVATVADAQQASERWGRAAFRSEVEVWVLDCAAGREMDLPSALVNRPTAVLAYAAAHFRPRSLSSDQCAIVVVAASSSYNVVQRPPAPM